MVYSVLVSVFLMDFDYTRICCVYFPSWAEIVYKVVLVI